jgi:hypothetical protein
MSGANVMTILTGNPLRDKGFFYDTQVHLTDLWWTRHVSCAEVSRENPQALSPAYREQLLTSWGEHSNEYRVRWLGEFPISDDNAIIPRDVIEASLTRDVPPAPRSSPVVWGVDVAYKGADRTGLAKRQANHLCEPIRLFHQLDTMQVASWVKLEWDQTPPGLRPVAICVDANGFGAGVADRLRQLGLPARAIMVSEAPATNAETYADLRTELWFKARAWFARRDCRLPASYQAARPEDSLVDELTGVHYGYRKPSMKITVEAKDVTKRRLRRSPDIADAFVMTFAVDAIVLAQGRDSGYAYEDVRERESVAI